MSSIESREPQFVKIWRFGDQMDFDFDERDSDLSLILYKGYNSAGYNLIRTFTPAFGKIYRLHEKLEENNRLLVDQIKILRGIKDFDNLQILVNEDESYIYVESPLDKHFSRPRAVWLPINPENINKFRPSK